MIRFVLPFLLARSVTGAIMQYTLTKAGDIVLSDVATSISPIKTIFEGDLINVSVTGIEWELLPESNWTNDTTLYWEMAANSVVQQTGKYDLTQPGEDRVLPVEIECGSTTINEGGSIEISVKLTLNSTEQSTSSEYQSFSAGISIIPLLIVLVLAMTTHMVELSLFSGIFVGACIVTGNIEDGFKTTLSDYLVNALVDADHVYVILFTLFLSGMVGMMQKSGGMIGFTNWIGQYAVSPRAGQLATFAIGLIVFFDDYANTLLAGQTMRPLTDLLFISREKLAFLVDATAAPVASISPISSWVGFEVSLIETEIQRIESIVGKENLTIDDSGLAVFFQSIAYRYYPWFMLFLMPLLIITKRDFGPMLIAERKTQVYERTDGGDNAGREGGVSDGGNEPCEDTPKKAWNMLIPIVLLVFFIFYLLVATGADAIGHDADFIKKIEASDNYSALLWGTMATSLLSLILYLIQIVQYGELVIPTWSVMKLCFTKEEKLDDAETKAFKENDSADVENNAAAKMEEPSESQSVEEAPLDNVEEAVDAKPSEATEKVNDASTDVAKSSKPRSLMSIHDSVEAFLFGMGRIFPALIVLTLAWASGALMTTVGADRLFSKWITEGVAASILPTLSFIISLFMALATGTSWGTMTILFPLLCLPTYVVSEGDPTIFYATVAGILSGSVAGDHMSPISDTTVLSSLSADCKLLAHVLTQGPYAIIISIFAILLGTLPAGAGGWPNWLSFLLGFITVLLFVLFVCVPILAPSGRFDIFTQLYIMCKRGDTPLVGLKEDTIKKCSGSCDSTTHTRGDEEKLADSADSDSGGDKEDDGNGEKAASDEENVVIPEEKGE